MMKCPRCGTGAPYSPENPFRPFCSERCKLIDLGNWADGTYSIPTADVSTSVSSSGATEDDAHEENSDDAEKTDDENPDIH